MKLKLIILIILMFLSTKKQIEPQVLTAENNGMYNSELPFIHSPESWHGNPVNDKNQFVNIDSVKMPSFGDLLRWKFGKKPQKKEKKADTFKVPVVNDTSFLHHKHDVIVWLGHATFYIRMDGISLITDPVFFDLPFLKRNHTRPFDPNLITGLDYILVSHNHRDHCDKKSLKLLSANNPQAVILTGLRMERLLSRWVSNRIQEAGWFQKYITTGNIRIVYLPAQHWSKRLSDTNETLWGAYVLETPGVKIYFGGDTGWGSHFEYAGRHFGPFDVCILPIGAYSPRWFMKSSHINPAEAFKAFGLLNAKALIPMHYGTYDLSDEPPGEPIRLLENIFNNYPSQTLINPVIGRPRAIKNSDTSVNTL